MGGYILCACVYEFTEVNVGRYIYTVSQRVMDMFTTPFVSLWNLADSIFLCPTVSRKQLIVPTL